MLRFEALRTKQSVDTTALPVRLSIEPRVENLSLKILWDTGEMLSFDYLDLYAPEAGHHYAN